MKIMFASDIHGSAYYCRRMLDIYSESGAGRLVILGDILYHGPRNDLPREYAPKEVIAMLNPLKNQIYAIRGNCDTEVDQMVLEFPIPVSYTHLDVYKRQGSDRRYYLCHFWGAGNQHGFRHSYACKFERAGAKIVSLHRGRGHADLRTGDGGYRKEQRR